MPAVIQTRQTTVNDCVSWIRDFKTAISAAKRGENIEGIPPEDWFKKQEKKHGIILIKSPDETEGDGNNDKSV